MYATKRRRRSMKGNAKVCGKSGLETCNGNGTGALSLKSNPSKRHRERLNTELERLASLLPFDSNILNKLDKLSILRLSVSFLRIKSYFQVLQQAQSFAYDSIAAAGAGGGSVGALQHHHQQHAHQSSSSKSSASTSVDRFHQTLDPALTRTESVLKALNGFVLVLTCNEGEVFYASNSIEEFLGFHQSDVIHQKVSELIHSEDRTELHKQLAFSPLSLQDSPSAMERCLTARFRCLLDNTSGFLRLEIRGRIGVLHGQNCHTGEHQFGLLAICCPYGPPALVDNVPKDAGFKSKHKLDLTLVNLDSKGKSLLGFEDDSSGGPTRSFYNWLHPDDLQFVGSAHRTLIKMGSCNLLAYRVLTKSHQWQWLQTTMKTVFKNGKPDHVTATHQPLGDEEALDRMPKRDAAVRDLDMENEKFLPDDSHSRSPTKTKKRSSPPVVRENGHHAAVPPANGQTSRRRKSTSADTSRSAGANEILYSSAYPALASDGRTSSLSYCANAYSTAAILDSARLFSSDVLMPYSQYGAGLYAGLPDSLPQSTSLAGSGLLDNGRSYELYAASAYPDVLPNSGDYFKNYYKNVDAFTNGGDVSGSSRLRSSYGNVCAYESHAPLSVSNGTSAMAVPLHVPYNVPMQLTGKSSSASSAWMSHHRQSVVVYNSSRSHSMDSFKSGSSGSAWSSTANGSGASVNFPNAHSAEYGQAGAGAEPRVLGLRNLNDVKDVEGVASSGSSEKANGQPAGNFSISEATDTMLDSAG